MSELITIADFKGTSIEKGFLNKGHKYIKRTGSSGNYKYTYKENQGIIETKEFKDWFGNSKIVDKSGKPLIVYHGTFRNFESFGRSNDGNGIFYFAKNPNYASKYAKEGYEEYKDNIKNTSASVIPVYLKVKNLKKVNFGINDTSVSEYLLSLPKDNKLPDGLIGKDLGTNEEVLVVFNSKNIKSAIGNKTFNPNKKDILKSL